MVHDPTGQQFSYPVLAVLHILTDGELFSRKAVSSTYSDGCSSLSCHVLY